MHLRFYLLALSLASAPLLSAQELYPPADESAVEAQWTPEELEDLLAPIALHPDALIALILPSATNPSDVVLAARRLALNADPNSLDGEPWDDSVRGLARYPEIIKWMDENLAWTKEVGQAFAAQPADVMNAIQRLRAKARAAGTLVDTPQQQVVAVEEEIRIVPARQDVIYVPRYDPAVVYVSRPVYYPSAFFTFGIGYPVGHWLAYDCDWRRHKVWIVAPPHRARVWYGYNDWRHHRFADRRDDCWYTWRPRPHHPKPGRIDDRRDRDWPSRGHASGRTDNWRELQVDRDHRDVNRQREWNRERRDYAERDGELRPAPGSREWRRDHADNPGGRRGIGDRTDHDRRRGVVTAPTPLPSGPTPTIAPPVAPVAPVNPVTDLTPRNPSPAPQVLPNGRRLPERREPEHRVQLPNGRYISAPTPQPAPRPAPTSVATYAPAQPTSAPTFQRPEIRRVETPRMETPRPPRVESPRADRSAPTPRSEPRQVDRSSDNGRSQTQRHLD